MMALSLTTGQIILIVGGAWVVLLLPWALTTYNGLVRLRNAVKNAWSQIDVQLKRRHDLIPNLVETVKGYAGHEKTTLENVIKARNQALAAKDISGQITAEQQLSGALGRLMVVLEQYPDLKANQNFLALQEELTSTENKLGFARQYYNDSVMQYNNKIQSVPANIIAGMFRFTEEKFFEVASDVERQIPKVQFT